MHNVQCKMHNETVDRQQVIQLSIHCSLSTIHYSLFTVHCSLFIVHSLSIRGIDKLFGPLGMARLTE